MFYLTNHATGQECWNLMCIPIPPFIHINICSRWRSKYADQSTEASESETKHAQIKYQPVVPQADPSIPYLFMPIEL